MSAHTMQRSQITKRGISYGLKEGLDPNNQFSPKSANRGNKKIWKGLGAGMDTDTLRMFGGSNYSFIKTKPKTKSSSYRIDPTSLELTHCKSRLKTQISQEDINSSAYFMKEVKVLKTRQPSGDFKRFKLPQATTALKHLGRVEEGFKGSNSKSYTALEGCRQQAYNGGKKEVEGGKGIRKEASLLHLRGNSKHRNIVSGVSIVENKSLTQKRRSKSEKGFLNPSFENLDPYLSCATAKEPIKPKPDRVIPATSLLKKITSTKQKIFSKPFSGLQFPSFNNFNGTSKTIGSTLPLSLALGLTASKPKVRGSKSPSLKSPTAKKQQFFFTLPREIGEELRKQRTNEKAKKSSVDSKISSTIRKKSKVNTASNTAFKRAGSSEEGVGSDKSAVKPGITSITSKTSKPPPTIPDSIIKKLSFAFKPHEQSTANLLTLPADLNTENREICIDELLEDLVMVKKQPSPPPFPSSRLKMAKFDYLKLLRSMLSMESKPGELPHYCLPQGVPESYLKARPYIIQDVSKKASELKCTRWAFFNAVNLLDSLVCKENLSSNHSPLSISNSLMWPIRDYKEEAKVCLKMSIKLQEREPPSPTCNTQQSDSLCDDSKLESHIIKVFCY
jgi:hypothetical protein